MEGQGRCSSLSASPYGSAWFHLQAVYFIFGRSAFVCVTTPVDIVVISVIVSFFVWVVCGSICLCFAVHDLQPSS